MYEYPFGNGQQLNLDWFLSEWKNLLAAWEAEKSGIEGALQAEIDRAEAALADVFAARDAAAQSAANALESKNAAAQSATDASGYLDSVQQNATAAQNAAGAAADSQTAAQNAAGAAADSQTAAQNAARAATDSQTAAQNAASAAADSQTAAQNAASAAADSQTEAQNAASAAADSQTVAQNAAASVEASAQQIATNATDIADLKKLPVTFYNIASHYLDEIELSDSTLLKVKKDGRYNFSKNIGSSTTWKIFCLTGNRTASSNNFEPIRDDFKPLNNNKVLEIINSLSEDSIYGAETGNPRSELIIYYLTNDEYDNNMLKSHIYTGNTLGGNTNRLMSNNILDLSNYSYISICLRVRGCAAGDNINGIITIKEIDVNTLVAKVQALVLENIGG